jgi:hypothetical protein
MSELVRRFMKGHRIDGIAASVMTDHPEHEVESAIRERIAELETKLEAAEKHRKEVYLAYKDLISTRKGCMNNDYDEQLLQRAIDRLGGLAAFEGET